MRKYRFFTKNFFFGIYINVYIKKSYFCNKFVFLAKNIDFL